MSVAVGIMQLAGLASIGAGAIHAGAAGLHAETPTLARLFVAVAVAQIGIGLLALVKGGRLAAAGTVLVNLGAVAAWGADAPVGDQLDRRAGSRRGPPVHRHRLRRARRDRRRSPRSSPSSAAAPTSRPCASGCLRSPSASSRWRRCSSAPTTRTATPSRRRSPPAPERRSAADGHAHSHDDEAAASGAEAPAAAAPADWPRPFDPAQPVDLSGVDGVTPEQELRATALVQQTQEELPAFADVASLEALGYRSIGDSRTGYEHYINYSLINDDVWLDPTQPESLVFRVDGDERTLVSAMFIVGQRAIDDPELVDYGGRLMQWHVHENLCWRGGENGPQVAGGHRRRGQLPGRHGARRRRQPDGPRVDRPPRVRPVRRPRGPRCRAGCRRGRHADGPVRPRRRPRPRAGDRRGSRRHGDRRPQRRRFPTIPNCPSTCRGRPASLRSSRRSPRTSFPPRSVTCRSGPTPPTPRPPASTRSATPRRGTSTTSSGSGSTTTCGSIPTTPRAWCTASSPTAHARWRRRCTCCPTRWRSTRRPTTAGALMQWHVHGDLCFDVSDPEAPRVGGLTDAAGGCTAPLVRAGRVADDPRVDRAPRVRPVRRPRRRRRRPGRRRRRAPLRPRPRQHHRLTIWAACDSLVDSRTPTSSQPPNFG